MAAIHTFDWLVQQVWPHPGDETKRFIKQQRDYLLNLRNENERLMFTQELMDQIRQDTKRSKKV